ncbi:MAG: MaoC family dehydratase N-terminal domain-containing protein [Chloroflexi bacterium]|nr:MaoC family dehydratase N-terminal domain-containing protein [Chloroflexota bacterium]
MAKAYSELEAGYEFPPGNYKLDAARVSLFLGAVGDASYPYLDNRLVPPMAVAALAMAALSNTVSLPAGAVHVSQELGFVEAVRPDENLTSYARLSRTQKRGKLHVIAIDFDVRSQAGKTVLTGKTSFILPQDEEQ